MRMMLVVAVCAFVCVGSIAAQQTSSEQKSEKHSSSSMGAMHDPHGQMNERGEKGMGFSQTSTAHHFLLNANGGVIQVETKDPADAAGRDEIRMHLGHIRQAFQNGEFDIPMFVHDTVPPGEEEMRRLKKKIRYSYEERPNGGRVVIFSTDKKAQSAIHKFLRFQIEEHKTGDPEEVR